MRTVFGRVVLGIVMGSALPMAACAHSSAGAPDEQPPVLGRPGGTQLVNEEAQALASLQERIKEYLALHDKLEATLPPLPADSTPRQIDTHQRALARLIQNARREARPGDIFTRDSRGVIRGLMMRVFRGPDGAKLKASIMDENPGRLQLTVNSRYPDTVPLSTVPPQVLAGLPKLPEELEFRFIGRTLILLDVHAHLIADLIDNIVP
jgi:hypothetical protein